MNNNKVVNKQISLRTILDIANYFEDYKERYEEIYRKENERNKNKSYGEKNYEYENGNIEVRYTIDFHNGQNLTESNYNWFVSNTNNPKAIKTLKYHYLIHIIQNQMKVILIIHIIKFMFQQSLEIVV